MLLNPSPEELPPRPSIPLWDASEPQSLWRLGREWSGYPELEWTPAIFVDRVLACSGNISLLFYEQLSQFTSVQFLIRIESLMRARREPSYPSISLGFNYYDSAYRVPDGRLLVPTVGDPWRGRHFVSAIDRGAQDELAFANSWGRRWGDRGYGAVSRQYFETQVDGVFIRWSAVGGPSSDMVDCLEHFKTRRLPRREQFPHCWPSKNTSARSYDVLIGNRRHQLVTWTVMSLETSRIVYVFEIHNPAQIIGRAHLFVESEERATLRELFVVPRFRRRGYAAYLEDCADQKARTWARELEIWLHEGDARDRTRPAAKLFAESRGYSWSEVSMTRPNIVAIARKQLQ